MELARRRPIAGLHRTSIEVEALEQREAGLGKLSFLIVAVDVVVQRAVVV
jgi:hypothetical protein